MGDDRVPILPKGVTGLTLLYGVSPIDLIPEFLLGIGLVDDAVLVPAGLALAVRLIPAEIREELREQARADRRRWRLVGVAVLVAVIVLVALLLWWLVG